jgi:hypothetical protein
VTPPLLAAARALSASAAFTATGPRATRPRRRHGRAEHDPQHRPSDACRHSLVDEG